MGAFSQKELEYLKKQALTGARGYIATVSRKQNPQLTPVGYVADEERIYVNIKHDSVKARNIRGNPRVSFVVDDFIPPMREVKIRGVSVSGKAELISSGTLHETGRNLFHEWFPFWEKILVREDGWSKYILVITPMKVRSWGLK
ncbi:5a,11a-dehydrotetracycline/5a,11a-dehydrooxytetracycline reductase [subsurface metagenome]|jgi:nitroimidazol reductase NimA-like FMN-containing flavoprotein (pyridoxamine 5'-phosphate oxidase superfamily)